MHNHLGIQINYFLRKGLWQIKKTFFSILHTLPNGKYIPYYLIGKGEKISREDNHLE